jgi:hypothetical protein
MAPWNRRIACIALAAFTKRPAFAAGFEYCGGDDQTSGAAQLSCTAYPAKGDGYDQGSWCQSSDMFNLALNPSTNKQALVWQADGAEDYWVIHGCDGAGLMNDVDSSSFYLEHFMGTQQWRDPYDCSQYSPGDCQDPWNMDACWCQHWESPFVHPGTSQIYKYWSGMWTTCGAKWPDELAGKPWFGTLQASGLKSTSDYGCDPSDAATAFVITYPWVCNGPYKADYSAYWGVDANWQNGLPFGDKTYGINCYYDNEPFDILNKYPGSYDPHTQSTMVPPQLQVYKFVKKNSGDDYIHGWLIGKKDSSDAEFQDTTGGDGFWLKVRPEGPPY